MSKLLHEEAEKLFFNEQAATAFYEMQEKEEVWKHCYTNELTAFPIPGMSCGLYDADSIRTSCALDSTKISDETVNETLNSTKIGLTLPLVKLENYPVANSAIPTLMQRAGYSTSPVISAQKSKATQAEMPPENKAQVLNMGLKCFSNKALVLIRDEKIRAVLSGDENDYSRLPVSKLYKKITEVLGRIYPNWRFEISSVSHQFTTILVSLNDETLDKQIADTFAKANITAAGTAMIRVVTSDIGLSGANIFPVLRTNGGKEFSMGTPLCLTHSNKHTVEDFGNNLMQITAMFREATEKLEQMTKKRIMHPAGCLKVIGKRCGLPKQMVCNEAAYFQNTYQKVYEIDVYCKLFDLLDEYIFDKAPSQEKIISIQEAISRIAFVNMADYDHEYDWE